MEQNMQPHMTADVSHELKWYCQVWRMLPVLISRCCFHNEKKFNKYELRNINKGGKYILKLINYGTKKTASLCDRAVQHLIMLEFVQFVINVPLLSKSSFHEISEHVQDLV